MDTITFNLEPADVEYIIQLTRDDVNRTFRLIATHNSSMPEHIENALLTDANKHRKLADNFQLHLDMYKINREVM
jgi:hypothetical protein